MAEELNTSQLGDVFKTVEVTTKVRADASVVVKQSGAALDLVPLFLALLVGSFALAILDRIAVGTINVESPKRIVGVFTNTIVDVLFLFWVLNLVWIGVRVVLLVMYKAAQAQARRDWTTHVAADGVPSRIKHISFRSE